MLPIGHRALRRGRVSLPGHVYFTTTATRARARFFSDFDAACSVCRVLGRAASWVDAKPLAWVLMPDHLHTLVQLGEAPLPRVMQSLHSRCALAANRARGGEGPVWQGAFHDHGLRTDDSLLVAARYLIANPVRAGLVEKVGDYPFWDAVWVESTHDPMELLLLL
jgi:REP element-mobilizing transposase RayT